MIKTVSFSKLFNKFRRAGASLFTYDCAHCGKAVRGKALCEECEKLLSPADNEDPGFAAAYYYDSAARSAVLSYKFNGDDGCADMLCDWLIEAFENFREEKMDFAVSVPSFGEKETRLYELAKDFCTVIGMDFKPKMLVKIRSTRKQHDLSAKERKSNLSGAFEASDEVKGKSILLIDDIITTGTTAEECSKALLDKGAEKVFVLTVLKTKYEE